MGILTIFASHERVCVVGPAIESTGETLDDNRNRCRPGRRDILVLFHGHRVRIRLIANVLAFMLLTVPCWVAMAQSARALRRAKKIWSVVLSSGTWEAMNTSSGFGATRQLVFAGDRILAVFDAGLQSYEGNQPMTRYKLVSLDLKTGEVRNSKEFAGRWGAMPYLFAASDGHAILETTSLTKLNPDLSEAGPVLALDRGSANLMSPDGSTMAWETFPGTVLLDSSSLKPVGRLTQASALTAVRGKAVLTDNIHWIDDFPTESSFVTMIDEGGQHLLFHGDCGSRPEFLSEARVMLVSCGKIKIMDIQGKPLAEGAPDGSPAAFAGVSQNGRRFALEYSGERGDPSYLLYEYFIVYDSQTAAAVAKISMTDLPARQSWSAFSPDGAYFAAGSPKRLSLFRLP